MFFKPFIKVKTSLLYGMIFLLMGTLPHTGFAETMGTSKALLNFRASPNGKDLGSNLRPGEKFTILQTKGSWLRIKRSNGRVGWVYKKYVSVKTASAPAKAVAIKTEKTTTKATTTTDGRDAQLVGVRSGLNLRSGPSSRNKDIGTLKPSDSFQVIGQEKNGWYKIKTSGGKIGYASAKYIRVNEVTAPAEEAAVASATPTEEVEAAPAEAETEEDSPGKVSTYLSDLSPKEEVQTQSPTEDTKDQLAQAHEDTDIEAECKDCLAHQADVNPVNNGPTRDLIDIGSKVYDFHAKENQQTKPSSKEQCYAGVILKNAKEVVRKQFKNRSHSGGICATGVKLSLRAAGVTSRGSLGDAITYYKKNSTTPGTLSELGFVNEISKYKTAAKAPPGSVLVFSGPYTDKFLKNPWHYYGKGGKLIRRHGGTAGSYVGHVTIKGDDGRYYTDGRTKSPAIANRKLVGIFVMKECKECGGEIRRQCGG
jgi:uncharacterized protein YgiM (DUF1202 family)